MDIQQLTQHIMETFADLEVVFQNFCLNYPGELGNLVFMRRWEIVFVSSPDWEVLYGCILPARSLDFAHLLAMVGREKLYRDWQAVARVGSAKRRCMRMLIGKARAGRLHGV